MTSVRKNNLLSGKRKMFNTKIFIQCEKRQFGILVGFFTVVLVLFVLLKNLLTFSF